jgi:hypothetical protein
VLKFFSDEFAFDFRCRREGCGYNALQVREPQLE